MSPVTARHNPFAAGRVDALAWRPPVGGPTPEELLSRLDGLGGRAALVGPEGHGKTTLLEELGRRLARRDPDLRLRRLTVGRDLRPSRGELGRFTAGAGRRDVLLLDGAGHLPHWTWWRLCHAARRAAGLLVTTHRPCRLPTLLECTTAPELLHDLMAELLDGAPPVVALPGPLPAAADLHRRHAGNLRDALHELYDRCAGRAVAGAEGPRSGGGAASGRGMSDPSRLAGRRLGTTERSPRRQEKRA